MDRLPFKRTLESSIGSPGVDTPVCKAIGTLVDCLHDEQSIFAGADAPNMLSARPNKDGDQWLYCQSSGSRDRAKTIRRRPASWIASFEVNRNRYGLGTKDRYAVLGALSHSLTLYAILEGLHLNASLSVLSDNSPRKQLFGLQTLEITVLYATPSQLRLLLEAGKLDPTTLVDMRFVFCGGGKLDDACRTGIESLCPNAQIFEFYGASETSFITISDASTPKGSVGKCYPGVDLKICNTDGQQTQGHGEIWVHSPYLFDGYEVGDSKDTRWADGYLSVGEIGSLDAEGNLFLKGRKSRMVTVADQNVFLEDVELALQNDPDVTLCAALARDDAVRGHAIVAIVEGEPSDDLSKRLKARCRQELGAHATPKEIYYIVQLPMLPAGKPDLVALANWMEQSS